MIVRYHTTNNNKEKERTLQCKSMPALSLSLRYDSILISADDLMHISMMFISRFCVLKVRRRYVHCALIYLLQRLCVRHSAVK